MTNGRWQRGVVGNRGRDTPHIRRANEPPESTWSTPPMDTRNLRRITYTSPAFCEGIGYLMEGDWTGAVGIGGTWGYALGALKIFGINEKKERIIRLEALRWRAPLVGVGSSR
ncbi:hypothetical protein EVAR_74773_1 [Eumeta japonica]|uniref:Uncharacterized protein n=1 Tax=Eumeta variegata TaxID=151549 RepID=A0A4C1SRY2_EUMVA|nr:hypothetical protein EVAR_74773_1 [Eumeta japonica]